MLPTRLPPQARRAGLRKETSTPQRVNIKALASPAWAPGFQALPAAIQITIMERKGAPKMTPNMLAPDIQPRNALIEPATPQAPASQSPRRTALNMPALLASTIGHAAFLSDTPEKWASTIAML